jgi:hypothetical protein
MGLVASAARGIESSLGVEREDGIRALRPVVFVSLSAVAPPIERLGTPAHNGWNECLHGVGHAGVGPDVMVGP